MSENENQNFYILIVDDNPENIKVLGTILRQEKYKVIMAQSGEMAINASDKLTPNLILLDINMPEMNGFETCKILKNDPQKKDIPIIFLTAYTDAGHKKDAFIAGGVDYITKPFQKEEVLERVKTHIKIANYQKHLEIEVKQRTKELEAAILKIKKAEETLLHSQKMETVGTLAGGLAHDFNNILGGILGTTSIMNYKLQKGVVFDNTTLVDYVSTINYSCERAINMVKQLLSLSRKQEFTPSEIDLNMSVKHIEKIAKNSFDKSITIVTNHSDSSASIRGDASQIEQVILNLSINAMHAMTIMKNKNQQKGGVLTLSIDRFYADKSFCSTHLDAQETECWHLSVQDTGVGMSKETRKQIFNPFFTTKAAGVGTGLGLAMVYNIISNHKGIIDVYSEENKGTLFNIYFPLVESKYKKAEEKEKLIIPKGTGCVLVVDDEEIIRIIAKEILEESGYEVILAENGMTALSIYEKMHSKISVVLSDYRMPGMTGQEVVTSMKEINPNAKVIIGSGLLYKELIKELEDAGISGYIIKPYTIKGLAEKIKSVL